MDPNATWKELCEILGNLNDDNADRAWELTSALTEWISKGGALPAAMEHAGKGALLTILDALLIYVEGFDFDLDDEDDDE